MLNLLIPSNVPSHGKPGFQHKNDKKLDSVLQLYRYQEHLIFGLTCFLKGYFLVGFSLQLTPTKDIPHTPAELITAQRVTSTACTGTSPRIHCCSCLFSTPAMMLPAPTLCQLHGNYWIYRFPSLASASFGADPALLVHLLLSQTISISKGFIHAPSQSHSCLAEPHITVITVITKSQANFGISHNFVPTSSAHKLFFFPM